MRVLVIYLSVENVPPAGFLLFDLGVCAFSFLELLRWLRHFKSASNTSASVASPPRPLSSGNWPLPWRTSACLRNPELSLHCFWQGREGRGVVGGVEVMEAGAGVGVGVEEDVVGAGVVVLGAGVVVSGHCLRFRV